ncbi:ABC transporter permease [Streptomyces sp. NPDC086835]|uniref:ABC transporter permease n=1 Tax=Streptomyces sp. NPDC086835 TaxID=3365761 RepID=UPI00382FE7F7
MTAPLTPPHQPHEPSRDDNVRQAPPAGPGPSSMYAYDTAKDEAESAAELRKDLRDSALILVAVTLLGIALGFLWLWLAPRVPLVSNDEAVFLKDTEGEEAIGADGTFLLLGVALGVLTAVAVFLFRRRGGIALVLALAVGAVLGSLLGWGIGVWFGPSRDVVEQARQVGEGVTFDAYLDLRAKGALLAWPVAAMLVHLGLTALFGPRDPEPEWPTGPTGAPAPRQ